MGHAKIRFPWENVAQSGTSPKLCYTTEILRRMANDLEEEIIWLNKDLHYSILLYKRSPLFRVYSLALALLPRQTLCPLAAGSPLHSNMRAKAPRVRAFLRPRDTRSYVVLFSNVILNVPEILGIQILEQRRIILYVREKGDGWHGSSSRNYRYYYMWIVTERA
jgi:hypothetical protein